MKIQKLVLAASLLMPAMDAICAQPLLVISIDGLPARYLAEADARGLKVPNLRSFIAQGTAARGVVGVTPTVTYPSHTTMVTGVAPALHGIHANTPFDPLLGNDDGWYWYAGDIRVPTLWSAASQAGLSTAAVNWSVTVGDRHIDTLLPEFWRRSNGEDLKLLRALGRPEGVIEAMEAKLGPFVDGNTETLESDRIRTRFAVAVLKERKPQLMGVHLISLDGTEHHEGPDTPAAYAVLEALDGMVGELVQAAVAARPDTAVAIVSDHGFIATHTLVNLRARLASAGLMQLSDDAQRLQIRDWQVQAWSGGGSAEIVLKDPRDASLRERVRDLLAQLGAEPRNGIARVLDSAEVAQLGGFPDAAFMVEFAPGFGFGTALRGDLLTPSTTLGMHGYLPARPEMHAVFYIKGQGIARQRDLGIVDMRQLAPTFARVLGVSLPSADQPPLSIAAARKD